MLATIMRPGVWKRAGLTAVLAGLDLAEAMRTLPRQLDRDFARRLLVMAEASYMSAALAAGKDANNKG